MGKRQPPVNFKSVAIHHAETAEMYADNDNPEMAVAHANISQAYSAIAMLENVPHGALSDIAGEIRRLPQTQYFGGGEDD